MTSTDYLPFERGIKDGLLIYLRRLGVFLAVLAVASVLCGLIGLMFIPRADKPKPAPSEETSHFEIITFVALGTGLAVFTLRKTMATVFQIQTNRFTLTLGSTLFVILCSGLVASIFTRDLEVVVPLASALLVHLFDGFVFLKDRGDELQRRRSRRRK